MPLFFQSCCRATLPASITKPKKINTALCINTATITQHSQVQGTHIPLQSRHCLHCWHREQCSAPWSSTTSN